VPKTYEQLANQVTNMREQLPLLPKVDQIKLWNLFFLTIGEVQELQEAFHDQPGNHKEWGMEYNDIIVFAVSLAAALGLLDSTVRHPRIYASNGEAKASNFYERLTVVILDAQDTPTALVEVFRLLHSFAHHTPMSPEQLFALMTPTVDKVLANRPTEFFQPRDPQTGRELNDEAEIIALYHHLEAMFRIIRKHVQRTLQPSDWQPHRDLISQWHNSAAAQEQLRLRLQTQPKPGDFMLTEGDWFSPEAMPSGILVARQRTAQVSEV